MDWITTSGGSIDEAKSNALDQLGIVADEAEFDVVNDVQKGLFGRVKTEAKIRARVRPKQPAAKDDRGRRRSGGGGGKGRGGNGGGGKGRGGNNRGGQGKSNGGRQSSSQGGGNNRGGQGKSNNTKADNGERQESKAAEKPREAAKAPEKRNNGSQNGGRTAAAAANTGSEKEKKGNVEHEFSREEQEKVATDFLEGILDVFDMEGAVAVVAEEADDYAIEMSVTGSELGLLVGPKGSTLNALQELTRTVVQREADGAKTERLRVDVAGYRERRTAALQDFARKIAADVAESGNEKVLEPMGPADRKVVHDALNDMDGVETGSEGEEPRRRVVIRPA
jgi:spoIIIJ-associated protein